MHVCFFFLFDEELDAKLLTPAFQIHSLLLEISVFSTLQQFSVFVAHHYHTLHVMLSQWHERKWLTLE